MDKHVQVMMETWGLGASPITPQMFANAGQEHMEKYGMYVCVVCVYCVCMCAFVCVVYVCVCIV